MSRPEDILKFEKPAENWENRLPLGNGRLGVMLKGEPFCEGLSLNEEGIWSGGPMDRNNTACAEGIEDVRKLMKAGKIREAQEKAYRVMAGNPVNMRVYQNAGDFNIDFFGNDNYGVDGPMQNHGGESYNAYKMNLDMKNSIAEVSYTDEKGTCFTRRTFVSAVDDAIFMYVTASENGKLNFRGGLDRGIWADKVWGEKSENKKNGMIFLEDRHGVPFCTGAEVLCEKTLNNGNKIICNAELEGAKLCGNSLNEALFVICIKSFGKDKNNRLPENLDDYDRMILEENHSWVNECRNQLEAINQKILSFPTLFDAFENFSESHKKEAGNLYDRMKFSLGNGCSGQDEKQDSKAETLATPKLLEKLKEVEKKSENVFADGEAADASLLINQYANFGRYLLISSSRKPGILPANLQGIWNCYMDPPWGSKYTININMQMNYWASCMANLAECEEAVFELLERGYRRGKKTARIMYNCPGYVMHHNTDIWGDSAPQDPWIPGTYWTLGSGWIATHIWEHYEYTLDQKLLERYYYLIHEACQFYAAFLQESDFLAPDGKPYLILNPSASPENSYKNKNGTIGVFSPGCEMDNQILTHLFESCLKAMNVLGEDGWRIARKTAKDVMANCKTEELMKNKGESEENQSDLYEKSDRQKFEYVLSHIKKPSMNKDGSIMEWNEEFEEIEPGHRHISHLYGLFPGHSISVEKTPELAEGAKKTLTKRLSSGGGHTGWSQAWIINFRAALRQGEEAGKAVTKILTHSTNPNLLDVHPPFQIDGNFGALSGILRMLIQSEMDWDKSNTEKAEPAVKLYLLPALPHTKIWKSGKLCGIKAKGNLTVDLEWDNWEITRYEIKGSTKYEVI